MSTIDTVAVEQDPLYAARQDMLDRVRAAIDGCTSRAEALHKALDVVGAPVGWHEAEVVAEALRHRYDDVYDSRRWMKVSLWREPDYLGLVRRDMRRELVLAADETALALVDEPVEWTYAAPDLHEVDALPADDRGRTPLTAAQVAALPDNYLVLVKLVGHVQKLTADA